MHVCRSLSELTRIIENPSVAYSFDPRGDEVCEARVRELSTGKEWTLPEGRRGSEEIDGGEAPDESGGDTRTRPLRCDGSLVWDEAGGLFWVELDGSHRPHRLYHRRVLDDDGRWIEGQADELLFGEDDELYNLRISKSFDGRYLLIRSGSKEASEVRYVDLRPERKEGTGLEMRMVAPRAPGWCTAWDTAEGIGSCRRTSATAERRPTSASARAGSATRGWNGGSS